MPGLTYEDGLKLLCGRSRRKLPGVNTYLISLSSSRESIGIVYHNTVVVAIYPNGHYRIDNGGIYSRTTKARIRQYSGACLYQHKGIWYVGNTPFERHMRLDARGVPLPSHAALAQLAGLDASAPEGIISDRLRDLGLCPKTGIPV